MLHTSRSFMMQQPVLSRCWCWLLHKHLLSHFYNVSFFFFSFNMNQPKLIDKFQNVLQFLFLFPRNLHRSLISQFLRPFHPQQWSKTQRNPEPGLDESGSWWIRRWNARDASCRSEEHGGCSPRCTVWTSVWGRKDSALHVGILLNSMSDDRIRYLHTKNVGVEILKLAMMQMKTTRFFFWFITNLPSNKCQSYIRTSHRNMQQLNCVFLARTLSYVTD